MQNETQTKITIRDVAKRAGVSCATVSRVLNKLDRVSEETRQRVNAAIEELSFTRSSVAASIITGKTKTVLIMVPDFFIDFYGELLLGAHDVFQSSGYLPLAVATKDDPDVNLLDMLQRMSDFIDGALIIPATDKIDTLSDFPKPIVIVDRSTHNCPFDSVTFDNYQCSKDLTNLLLDRGHTKIALIASDSSMNVGHNRVMGYMDALQERGITPDPKLIRRGAMARPTGYDNTISLMQSEDPPTAIVAGSKLICIGCLQALNDLKLQMGKDISLVSVDENDLASCYNPGITSAFTPRVEMGQQAAERLLTLLQSNLPLEPEHVVLPSSIYDRESIVDLTK